jgi:hypothetical protein
MDHRHYEQWLLNDERLTLEQERDLRNHQRTCSECAALARANLALRSAPVAAPAEGFALRFQTRLAAERKTQRRRSMIGLFLLTLVGVSALAWLALPYLTYLRLPPQQIFALWISNLVYIALVARTVSMVGFSLLNVAASFIPAYAWMIALAVFALLSFLLNVSVRRVGQFAKSAA